MNSEELNNKVYIFKNDNPDISKKIKDVRPEVLKMANEFYDSNEDLMNRLSKL